MAKKTYIADRVAAGAVNFQPGDELELTDAEAKPLLEAEAIIEKPGQKPAPTESKRTNTKTKATRSE